MNFGRHFYGFWLHFGGHFGGQKLQKSMPKLNEKMDAILEGIFLKVPSEWEGSAPVRGARGEEGVGGGEGFASLQHAVHPSGGRGRRIYELPHCRRPSQNISEIHMEQDSYLEKSLFNDKSEFSRSVGEL